MCFGWIWLDSGWIWLDIVGFDSYFKKTLIYIYIYIYIYYTILQGLARVLGSPMKSLGSPTL